MRYSHNPNPNPNLSLPLFPSLEIDAGIDKMHYSKMVYPNDLRHDILRLIYRPPPLTLTLTLTTKHPTPTLTLAITLFGDSATSWWLGQC